MAERVVGVELGAGGLTIQQAATVAGVSERTVRRWIKEGTLAAEKVPTAQGYEWRVQLDGAACLSGGRACRGGSARVDGMVAPAAGWVESAAEEVGEALVRAVGLVERLQRENLELAGRVGFLQGKLQETQAQLLALAPPAAAPPAAPAGPTAGPPRGGLGAFWRRLWRAEGQRAGV